MEKIKEVMKRFKEKLTLSQLMGIYIITVLLLAFVLAIFIKEHNYWLVCIIVPLIVVIIYSVMALCEKLAKKLKDKSNMRLQEDSLEVVQKYLSNQYKKILFVNKNRDEIIIKNRIKKDSFCWARLDENNVITILIADDKFIVFNTIETTDYLWFILNFYVL